MVAPEPIDARSEPEQPEPAAPPRRDKHTTWSRLASDVVAAAELAEEVEDDLEALRHELIDSRKAQRRAEQERDEALLLVHEGLIFEGARNGGARTTRKQGEAIA